MNDQERIIHVPKVDKNLITSANLPTPLVTESVKEMMKSTRLIVDPETLRWNSKAIINAILMAILEPLTKKQLATKYFIKKALLPMHLYLDTIGKKNYKFRMPWYIKKLLYLTYSDFDYKDSDIQDIIASSLARIIYYAYHPKKLKRLIYVMGNKRNSRMCAAIENIIKTREYGDFSGYIEPCCGGLSLSMTILNLLPDITNVILNDDDWDKTNLFKIVMKDPEKLLELCLEKEVSKEFFQSEKIKEQTARKEEKGGGKTPSLERAARYLYLNLTSARGKCGSFNSNKTVSAYRKNLISILTYHDFLLQQAKIKNEDLLSLLEKNVRKSTQLIVVDPPYFETSGFEERNTKGEKKFSKDAHEKMSQLLNRLSKKNAIIYFCRSTCTREKSESDSNLQARNEKLRKQLEAWYGDFYYIDIVMDDRYTTERIYCSFNFEGATEPINVTRGGVQA